jgi:hypothetical protein
VPTVLADPLFLLPDIRRSVCDHRNAGPGGGFEKPTNGKKLPYFGAGTYKMQCLFAQKKVEFSQ